MILNLIHNSPELIETIYNYSDIKYLLSVSLIMTDNTILKKKMAEGLVKLFEECNRSQNIILSAQEFFLPMLWHGFFKIALEKSTQAEVFFELLQKNIEMLSWDKEKNFKKLQQIEHNNKEIIHHIEKIKNEEKYDKTLDNQISIIEKEEKSQYKGEIEINLGEMLSNLVELITGKPFYERSHNEKDCALIGIFNLISSLLKRLPERTFEIGQTKGLLNELLGPCLFETPRKSIKADVYPKCKSYQSRCAAFNLIFILASECNQNLRVIMNYLLPLHLKAEWRTKSISDWNIIPKINEKSETGYVGLKNLGCSKLFFVLKFKN